jgi:MauM/NapG family ferredoxin protein
VQSLSLLFFLQLLWTMRAASVGGLLDWLPPDLYLRLDPLVAVALPLTVRDLIPSLLPGLGAALFALLIGRAFCGYVCPFGATLDLARFLGARRATRRSPRVDRNSPESAAPLSSGERPRNADSSTTPVWHWGKYLLLAAALSSAVLGVNAAFVASPIPLITRFYATLVFPLVQLAGKQGMDALRPVADMLDWSFLAYAQVGLRRFEAVFFILVFFGALFALEQVRPRFWCRYLCPAGALLGLLSFRPLWRRRVGRCTDCGQCRRHCPTGAIDLSPSNTAHRECIVCRRCEAVCPGETRFSTSPVPLLAPPQNLPSLPERRLVLQAGLAGAACAAGCVLGLDSLQQPTAAGIIHQPTLIRPPGAVPEEDFLRLCLRCGACMQACPSNGLQPTYFLAGVAGMFSPVLVPRRGPCEASCNACGLVCPSRALRKLSLEEKQRAKIGAALVLRERCLAWEQDKRCVVCQEVCPYGAISLRPLPDHQVPAPFVKAERCFGCGACECHCPVASPAVIVEAAGALRLRTGSYIEAAREAMLTLELEPKDAKDLLPGGEELPEGALPPGFTQ